MGWSSVDGMAQKMDSRYCRRFAKWLLPDSPSQTKLCPSNFGIFYCWPDVSFFLIQFSLTLLSHNIYSLADRPKPTRKMSLFSDSIQESSNIPAVSRSRKIGECTKMTQMCLQPKRTCEKLSRICRCIMHHEEHLEGNKTCWVKFHYLLEVSRMLHVSC